MNAMKVAGPNTLGFRIKNLRKIKDMSQTDLAAKVGVPQSTVSKWERGENEPSAASASRVALALGVTTKEVMGMGIEPVTPGRRVRVVGELSASNWAEAIEYADPYEAAVMLPDDLANIPLQGFVVRGPSVNRIYPDGSIVYVAPVHSIVGAPKNGSMVMVMRTDKHGITEATLKQYAIDEAGKKWLWPRSDHPEHQAPLNYLGKKDKDVESVNITGVVVAALIFPII